MLEAQEIYGDMMSLEELETRCAEQGLKVMQREPKQLLIDWDSSEEWPTRGELSKKLFVFDKIFHITRVMRCRSKSGNWHIAIDTVTTFTEAEAIGLELSLGSDPFRFLLGMRSVKEGRGVPSTLFIPEGNQFEAFTPDMIPD